MATKLDKTLKRELEIEGKLYTVSISPEGVKIVPKGGRKGRQVRYKAYTDRAKASFTAWLG